MNGNSQNNSKLVAYGFGFGVMFLISLLIISLVIKDCDRPFLGSLFPYLVALSGAAFAAGIPGTIGIKSDFISGAGALGVLVLLIYFKPIPNPCEEFKRCNFKKEVVFARWFCVSKPAGTNLIHEACDNDRGDIVLTAGINELNIPIPMDLIPEGVKVANVRVSGEDNFHLFEEAQATFQNGILNLLIKSNKNGGFNDRVHFTLELCSETEINLERNNNPNKIVFGLEGTPYSTLGCYSRGGVCDPFPCPPPKKEGFEAIIISWERQVRVGINREAFNCNVPPEYCDDPNREWCINTFITKGCFVNVEWANWYRKQCQKNGITPSDEVFCSVPNQF